MDSAEVQWNRSLALVLFSRRFSTLIDAGLGLVKCLITLQEDTLPEFSQAIKKIQMEIEQGSTLSRAMGMHPDFFPPFYIKLVRVGEIMGMLEVSLEFLADLLEEEWKIIHFSGRETGRLPLLNRTGPDLAQNWEELDALQKKVTLLLFCRTWSDLLSAGVPPKMSLETSAELLPVHQRAIVQVIASSLENSDPHLGERLEEARFLPSLITQLIRLHQDLSTLDKVLGRIADNYRHELQCEWLNG